MPVYSQDPLSLHLILQVRDIEDPAEAITSTNCHVALPAQMQATLPLLPLVASRASRIEKLPAEILGEIFSFAAAPVTWYSTQYTDWGYPAEVSTWLPLTLVCRYWRDIAYEKSSLWTNIAVYHDSRWLELALRRSRRQAVEVIFHTARIVPTAIYLLVAHARHIRKLFFLRPDMSTYCCLKQLSRVDMPVLEEVMCNRWQHSGVGGIVGWFDLNHARFPALTTIRCASVQIDWAAPILRRLTHLHLMDAPMFHPLFTFDNFLEVLEQCSRGPLRHLELGNSFPFFDNESFTTEGPFISTRIVHFPDLTTLSLSHSKPEPLRALLSHLHLNQHIRLFVSMASFVGEEGEDESIGLMDILPEDPRWIPLYQHTRAAILSTERTSDTDYDYSRLFCWADTRDGGSLTVFVAMESDATRCWGYSFDNALRDFTQLFRVSPIEEIRLSVEDIAQTSSGPKHRATTDTLIDLFATFPRIERLEFYIHESEASSPMPLVRALWTSQLRTQPSDPPPRKPLFEVEGSATLQCLLPKLRRLQIEHIPCCLNFLESLQGSARTSLGIHRRAAP
ncbi:hypothetical protein C8Q76DRAFT_697895 [Earliella scabrosa]|nr:hypothetical protein C8Q76DRAFT_697895 [Earliella scabrosa]